MDCWSSIVFDSNWWTCLQYLWMLRFFKTLWLPGDESNEKSVGYSIVRIITLRLKFETWWIFHLNKVSDLLLCARSYQSSFYSFCSVLFVFTNIQLVVSLRSSWKLFYLNDYSDTKYYFVSFELFVNNNTICVATLHIPWMVEVVAPDCVFFDFLIGCNNTLTVSMTI